MPGHAGRYAEHSSDRMGALNLASELSKASVLDLLSNIIYKYREIKE